MPQFRRPSSLALVAFFAAAPVCLGQATPASQTVAPTNYAILTKIVASTVSSGFDLSVACTKPVAPGFTRLKDPERLVVDLPGTVVGSQPSSISVNSPDVRAVRVNQFRKSPPITRIVLDLTGDREYSFEPGGSSFVVHLRAANAPPPKPAEEPPPDSRPGPGEGTYGLGLSTGASNAAVMMAGSHISPGSAVTAGLDTAVMRLERGGEVHVCPGTTVSITPSANGRSVMLGMSEGAVELHYALTSSADTVLTPDFRILLPGPGEFHFAISADTKGNTCVRALSGNTASAVVSELIGDGTYQVKPVEQVVFRAGRLSQSDANVPLECGCPPARQPQLLAAIPAQPGTMQASAALTQPVPQEAGHATAAPPTQPVTIEVKGLDPTSGKPAATPPPTVQVQVEAPFVFRGADTPPEAAAPAPAPPPVAASTPPTGKAAKAKKIKKEKVASAKKPKEQAANQPKAVPQTPPAGQGPSQTKIQTKPPTFFGKVKGFFRAIFK